MRLRPILHVAIFIGAALLGSNVTFADPITSVCGDGLIEESEQCDDANTAGGDGCSSSCDVEPGWGCTGEPSSCSPLCGNTTVDAGEECDDGNTDNDDNCTTKCKYPVCGDTFVRQSAGEECDDGNTDNFDGCSYVCLVEICGDTIVNGNLYRPEECDDGNSVDMDGCHNCMQTNICGNEILEDINGDPVSWPGTHELCDPPGAILNCTLLNDPNDPHPTDFTGGTFTCGNECLVTSYDGCHYCGNNTVEGAEECDDGNYVNGDGCSATCIDEVCGDGTVQGSEQCDDGGTSDGDGCNALCQDEFCGDGVTNGSEQCDDGTGNSDTASDACRTSCVQAWCGDGVTDSGEECDDGNASEEDDCSTSCTLTNP